MNHEPIDTMLLSQTQVLVAALVCPGCGMLGQLTCFFSGVITGIYTKVAGVSEAGHDERSTAVYSTGDML